MQTPIPPRWRFFSGLDSDGREIAFGLCVLAVLAVAFAVFWPRGILVLLGGALFVILVVAPAAGLMWLFGGFDSKDDGTA